MIHKDKLIYRYGTHIRIGTDDTDVVEINKFSPCLYTLLKTMDGNKSVEDISHEFNCFTKKQLVNLIVKLIHYRVLSILDRPLDDTERTRTESDFTYYYSEGLDGRRVLKTLKICILLF
jgi:hypothetical protein